MDKKVLIAYISDLEKRFNVKVKFKIEYIQSREEMNQRLERITEDWVVGSAKNGVIYIFKKELFPQLSPHPESHFDTVLKHEIAHLFIHRAMGKGPAWLDEGLACILAEQKKTLPTSKIDPTKLISREDFRKSENPYGKSMKLVYDLIKGLK